MAPKAKQRSVDPLPQRPKTTSLKVLKAHTGPARVDRPNRVLLYDNEAEVGREAGHDQVRSEG